MKQNLENGAPQIPGHPVLRLERCRAKDDGGF
jgi:hypothetical protein